MILAIDTSTEQASVALVLDGMTLSECSWQTGGNHSRHLTSLLREILALGDRVISDISAIAVAIGPGSFNGIRVGISEAMGLAMALDIPLVGIPTLDILGFEGLVCHHNVWAAIGAGRGQVHLAHYGGDWDSWERLSDYLTVPAEEAAAVVGPHPYLVGPGIALLAPLFIRQEFEVVIPPGPLRMRRAPFLAELGRRYLDAGGGDQLDRLEPLYLRRSAAEEKRAALNQE